MVANLDNRRIKLKGAYNFRDLGGYSTSDGKRLSWGKFFRSDNLARLTKDDLNRLKKLNIKLIIDLRTKEERLAEPSRLTGLNGINVKNLEISGGDRGYREIKRKIFYGKLDGIDLEKELLNAYRRVVTGYKQELKSFFNSLLEPSAYPMLVHCNAGKDRTGVIVALALSALDVSRETIMNDYMLSKTYLQPMLTKMVLKLRLFSFFRADIVQFKKIFDTRADFLNTTFTAIEHNFGSTKSFLESLGIDQEKCKYLKSILCS